VRYRHLKFQHGFTYSPGRPGIFVKANFPPGAASTCPVDRGKAPHNLLPIVPKEIFQALPHAAIAGQAGGNGERPSLSPAVAKWVAS
jgi:hypothetical protein